VFDEIETTKRKGVHEYEDKHFKIQVHYDSSGKHVLFVRIQKKIEKYRISIDINGLDDFRELYRLIGNVLEQEQGR
jgi:hypothetical protein